MEQIHFGLRVSELKHHVKEYRDKTNLQIMIEWARNMIGVWEIQKGDPNFKVLETAPHFFEVTNENEIQEYTRFLLGACLQSGLQ